MIDVFERQYRAALAVVMLLVLGDRLLVQPYLARLATDAPLINVSGRQRMLSQRLAKAALEFDRGRGAEGGEALGEVRRVLDLWSESHDRLLRGDGRDGRAVREALAALGPSFVAMRDAARRLLDSASADPPDAATAREAVAAILDHEGEYLRRMDRVVGLYEEEARGRIATFRRIGWALAGMTLASLVAIGALIFRPAAKLLRRQVDELARARDELEARVRERTKELEAARERHRSLLEQVSHAGRASTVGEMASALAHELNQPLGAVANYAEGCLIALEKPEPPLEEVRGALRQLRDATLRAGRIIGHVRRFVTRHGPSLEPFRAEAAVNDAIEILRGRLQASGAAVHLDMAPDLPCLVGDPVQIQQVLVNLVGNALDSLAQSQVPNPRLVIRTTRSNPDGVEFEVGDNGEGITPEILSRIFDAYFSTRADGMGMGLAICRTIVEAHQGRFFVESEPGVSTTFRFQIPAAPPDHERADGPHRG
ncbi:ATP-binding protein [Paludisphaera soli]|uniref:ATP-binding protein n=1 Tax=Paludisphaera soli TaxID=2712865 RepID=UPI0013E9AD01|nr:ATP-binding protein [Paludisphaera soli]